MVGADLALVVSFLPEVGDGAETDAEEEGEEDQADLDGGEAVALLAEDEVVGAVEEEGEAVEVAVIQCGEDDNGFGREEAERSAQRHFEQSGYTPLFELVGHVDSAGVAFLAQSSSSSAEQDRVSGLVAPEQDNSHDEPQPAANPQESPEHIAPSSSFGHEGHEEIA